MGMYGCIQCMCIFNVKVHSNSIKSITKPPSARYPRHQQTSHYRRNTILAALYASIPTHENKRLTEEDEVQEEYQM